MSQNPSLDLSIVNNKITNVNEILAILNNSELNEAMVEHMKTLSNRIKNMDITNKLELESALSSKIMEFESKQQENVSNTTSLAILRSINEDFEKLNIISTKQEDNDSNKYIDYLTYTNELGEVEMLSCDSSETLNNFIQANASSLPTMTAKDVFHYFKEYVHREVKFESPSELKNDNETRMKAIVNDPEIERQELEEVEKYKNTYGVTKETQVSIDNNGERIYRIGDGIIKFRTVEEKREMQVLKNPTLTKTATVEEMLAEIDATPEIPTNEVTTENNNFIKSDSYDSIESISDEDFNSERLDEIVARRDVYDLELTYEEEHELNTYIKYLLEHMKSNIDANIPADDLTKTAVSFMESARGEKASIIDTYTEIQNGRENEKQLSNLEKDFASKYIDLKNKMQALGLDKNQFLKRELEIKNNPTSGVTTLVVLLELITLAMFILMFLRLDI